jgi:hypothetical protein
MLTAVFDAGLEILKEVSSNRVARRPDVQGATVRQAAKLERLKLVKPLDLHLDQRVVQSTLRGMIFPLRQILGKRFWHRTRFYQVPDTGQPRSVALTGLV